MNLYSLLFILLLKTEIQVTKSTQTNAKVEIAALVQSTPDRRLLQALFAFHDISNVVKVTFMNFHYAAEISDKICATVEQSIRDGRPLIAILGPSTEPAAMVAESAAREIGLTFLALADFPDAYWQLARLRADNFLPSRSINVWPPRYAVGEVVSLLMDSQKDAQVLLLYTGPGDLPSIQSYVKQGYRPFGQRKTMFRVIAPNEDDGPLIKKALTNWRSTAFILHVNFERAVTFLRQAAELGLCNDDNLFVVTDYDAVPIDPKGRISNNKCNVTTLSIIDPTASKFARLRRYIKDGGHRVKLPDFGVFTKTAIWADTIGVLKQGIRLHFTVYNSLKPDERSRPDCRRLPLPIRAIRSSFTEVRISNALSGNVTFEYDGRRRDHEVNTFFSTNGQAWTKHGVWHSGTGNISVQRDQNALDSKSDQLHLKVTVYLEEPFVMVKSDSEAFNLTGNDQYEGYCIDLLEKIAELQNFSYEIHEVHDKTYGVREASGKWTGMVGELQSGVADLAVASLTVTYSRSEVLDFTVPYMHLGISILFKRPEASVPGLFHFMSPLGLYVWFGMLSAYIGTSIVIWMIARLSPYEIHRAPHSQFTLINSFWFTLSSLMQQGAELSPKSASTRIATAFWWFFALISISSYTANLAAFLTTERMMTPIENADDLAKQTKIKYGTLGRGSTMTFFNESKIETYEKMWKMMESQPSHFVKSSKDGIQRVKTSDYAYFMESSMLEYAIERDCELIQIGGLLDQKGYAIGLPKGSPHRELISAAILQLQEKTILTELKDKWWKQRGGGVCQQNKFTPSEYGARSVGGIFLILIGGNIIAIAISFIELVIEARERSKTKSSTISVELLKLIRQSWGEQQGVDDRLKRTIDNLIEYKDGVPVSHYSNPVAQEQNE